MHRIAVKTTAVAAVAAAALGGSTAFAGKTEDMQSGIRSCANTLRSEKGLSKLTSDRSLNRAAQAYAKTLAAGGRFSHTDAKGQGPVARVKKFTKRFGSGVGENLGAGTTTASAMCAQWRQSSGHRGNMLYKPYRYVGGGYAEGSGGPYYVQLFGTKKKPK